MQRLTVESHFPHSALPRTARGPNRMQDDTSGVATCTYARIACVEMPAGVRDLEEYWEEPSSYFLTQGELAYTEIP